MTDCETVSVFRDGLVRLCTICEAMTVAMSEPQHIEPGRFVGLHFKMGEPTTVQVLARLDRDLEELRSKVRDYRRRIIRVHGGVLPSIGAEGEAGAMDDGEDRT